MKVSNKATVYLAYLAIFTFYIGSCKKFVEVNPAPDLIETNSIFLSDKTALSAVSGVYAQLRTNLSVFTNGGLSVYGGLLADELYYTSSNPLTDQFSLNQLLPNNTNINSFFYSHSYRVIYQVNAILEGLHQSNQLTDSLKKQLTGEMKCVRAMMYFYLSNLFGEVPLVTSTDYKVNAVMPRTSLELINDQILEDIHDAKDLLSNKYPSVGKARPNKMVATALLARVYLFLGDWSRAESSASEVINSNMYALLPSGSISTVFNKNSSETIWEIATPNESSVTGEASAFIPSSTTIKPPYALTNNVMSLFNTSDRRRLTNGNGWLDSNKVSGVTYFFPKKYKQRNIPSTNPPTTSSEYQIVLRLSELYLIRAEARARQGNVSNGLADLNVIHTRAGLMPVNAVDQQALLNLIEKENLMEFFAEWGHRWLDLKRTSRADIVLSSIKGSTWQPTDTLFPIPETEITYNPFLTQNPGY